MKASQCIPMAAFHFYRQNFFPTLDEIIDFCSAIFFCSFPKIDAASAKRSKLTSTKDLNFVPSARTAYVFPTCLAPLKRRGLRKGSFFHFSRWKSMILLNTTKFQGKKCIFLVVLQGKISKKAFFIVRAALVMIKIDNLKLFFYNLF